MKVFFNNSCNICKAEIDLYKKENCKEIDWIDITNNESACKETEKSNKDLLRRLHVKDGDKIIDIFGRGGGKAIAEKFEVAFLGEIPIDPEIRKGGDNGQPIVYADPESKTSKAFTKIAETIMENL